MAIRGPKSVMAPTPTKIRQGIHAQLDAQVQHVQQAHGDGGSQQAGKLVDDILRRAARGDFVNDLLGHRGAAKQLPLHMTIGKEHLVEHARARQVCKQHAKGDGQQQQRLKLFDNRKVQQHAGNHQHNQAERILLDNIKARLLQKVDNSVHGILSLLL